ncbi:MAG: PhnD/SsuA/transferrin family substrate-binding protein [Coriobacteriia bacterium]
MLAIAVVSSIVALLFLGYTLAMMFRDIPVEPVPVSMPSDATGDTLVIAVGRTPGGQSEWANYVTLMKYLQDTVGRPIRMRYVADREEADEVFKSGEADAGFVCTRSYLLLREAGIVHELVAPITSGASTETAMVLVQADSEARTLEDLRGRSVAVSSRTSVSGASYLYWLADSQGFKVDEFFGGIVVSPTQEESLKKLERGEVDSAVGCSTEVKGYPAGTFRAVSVSPQYALPPFVVSNDLDEATVAKLRNALLGFDAEAMLPKGSGLNGFTQVSEEAYAFSFTLLEYIPNDIEKQ